MTWFSSLLARFLGDDRLTARLFSKSLADLMIKGTGLFALFGMNAVLARVMGVEAFGHFAFVSSAALVLSMFARQGMDSGVLRLIPGYVANEEWGLAKGLVGWTLKWVLVASVGMGLACLMALLVFRDQVSAGLFETALWGVLLLPLLTLIHQMQYMLRSRAWMVRAQVPDLVVRPLGVSLAVAFAWTLGWSVQGGDAMAITVGVSLIGVAFGWVWLQQSLPDPMKSASKALAVPEWRHISTRLLFVAGANMLLTQIDILMLGALQSTDESGVYTIASRLAAMAIFATIALGSFGAPLIAELYSQAKLDDLARIAKTMARVAFALLVPAVIFLVIVGEWVLALFGPEFAVAYYPLMVLMSGQALAACFGASAMILTMTAHESVAARILIGSVVANVILNAALIPLYGMMGAAVATALTTVVPVAAMSFMVRSRVGINPTII